jgi:hypothetical protein
MKVKTALLGFLALLTLALGAALYEDLQMRRDVV